MYVTERPRLFSDSLTCDMWSYIPDVEEANPSEPYPPPYSTHTTKQFYVYIVEIGGIRDKYMCTHGGGTCVLTKGGGGTCALTEGYMCTYRGGYIVRPREVLSIHAHVHVGHLFRTHGQLSTTSHVDRP